MSTNFDKIVHRWMRNEKMSGYIKKSTLAEELLNLAIAGKDKIKISSVINMIEGLQPDDVAPVVHGRWIDDDCAFMRCSLCGYENDWEWATLYCPNCGARMDGGESDD